MATLSKQGTETHRFELMQKTYSFRSNGKILRNEGNGWKLVTLKPGFTPETFLAQLTERESRLPEAFKAYRRAVQNEFPLSIRAHYLELAKLLDGDVDGIWAHLDDMGEHRDLETLRELNVLRELAKREHRPMETAPELR